MRTNPAAAPRVTFTLDVEDHRPDEAAELRFVHITREILAFLERRAVRGTFFVVGKEAQRHPDLVADIAAGGHEVALHSWDHTPLVSQTPDEFRAATALGKSVLEDLTGQPVCGYRAPTFSLVAESAWAPDILTDLGFTYSSSLLPAKNPLYGWPGMPVTPFAWPSGLVELPMHVMTVGPASLPISGGVYARVLPKRVIDRGLAAMDRDSVAQIYCHPYDFDPGERYYVVEDAGPLMSPLLWIGRRRMFRRVDAWLKNAGPPLAERVDELRALGALPIVSRPESSAAFEPINPIDAGSAARPTTPAPTSAESIASPDDPSELRFPASPTQE